MQRTMPGPPLDQPPLPRLSALVEMMLARHGNSGDAPCDRLRKGCEPYHK